MTEDTQDPQIYLITPPEFELSTFPSLLARVLDQTQVACVRLALASKDEDHIARAADACRAICHERDIALVLESHILMVERLGLDGVHLTDGARSVRKVRKELGQDAIVGTFCGSSRHEGLTAGEADCDYVAFGPVGETPLGDGSRAKADLFEWWSEIIEVPVIAEGALSIDLLRVLAQSTDFFAIGDEIWSTDDPAATLAQMQAAIQG
ncbi:thiamine phosphate synthase [Parasulfitobacter algicola]|uniref:Thiamine phosphate synthase n=1 Tax=Parasulfitobacter algicola TaxID=2614809 RepID=A0ABX2IRE3_9RHOB|nr:thiamine phosphate synthase [Sulfitobacter algicola]NSX55467.1 thiamine phosphate synthase [Sulfitobacter algicola]